LINENASVYSIAKDGVVTAWSDIALEDVVVDGDPVARALTRLQDDGGVVLDENWWNGQQWLVQLEPFPPGAPQPVEVLTSQRLKLIVEAVRVAAGQVGMAERAEVVTVFKTMDQIHLLDPSRRSDRARLVKLAQKALTPLGYELWDAFTGGGDLKSLDRGRDGRARRIWRTTRSGTRCSSVRHCSTRSTCTHGRETPLRTMCAYTFGTRFPARGEQCGRPDFVPATNPRGAAHAHAADRSAALRSAGATVS
jgi:hypothetical protein